jgi:ElaB/YqjD/DUF883 family membrane-anchored ribosome-binding protein
MTEDLFRIVVAVAVALACLAFLVQAGIMLALYRLTRKAQENAERFMGKVEPVMSKVEPMLDGARGVMDKAGPVIERIGPTIDRLKPAIERAGPLLQEARSVAVKTGALVDRATEVAATTNLVIRDARPHVAEISREATEITRLGREQVEQLGGLLHDAGEKARARLDQIDHSVESTIEHVERASGAMKRAVMKPVREVNGVAAGISAVVSTLVRGHRRSSVDAATQDEEMFI